MNATSTRPRRARARPRRRLRQRRNRLDLHALLFDHTGMLRPLGEIDSMLRRARASRTVSTTVFRMARRLWQADHVPHLDGLRLLDFPDISDDEEGSRP